MDLQVLSRNIRRLRNAKGMSQKRLAESAGISASAVKRVELARSEPRMQTLHMIAGGLGEPLHVLFRSPRMLHTVRFRSARQMRSRENVLAQVAGWLDAFCYLEDVLDQCLPFRLKTVSRECAGEDPVEAAKLCRHALGLRAAEPIHDICGLLEHAGVKVFPLAVNSEGFFGLSIGESDGGPAVVVNVRERITVERRIFSAAHELGHLILHPGAFDVGREDEDGREETEADLFAGHFLMPDEGFRNEWNEASGLHWIERVFKVKRIFRVSYKTVLKRLIEYGAADEGIWKTFHSVYRERYNRKLAFKDEPVALEAPEPFDMERFDFYEDRFSRLVREAIEKDAVSLSRGAEMLGISIEEMQELLRTDMAVL